MAHWILLFCLPTLGALLGWQARSLVIASKPSHRASPSAKFIQLLRTPPMAATIPSSRWDDDFDEELEMLIKEHFSNDD